ncbi:MAG: PKD domain-containing protein [Bacteroidia bacterium]
MIKLPGGKIFLALTVFFTMVTFTSRATHIVGGELNYHYLGNNIYQISLTVYRDCYNGVPPFDNPASVGIFNALTQGFIREKLFNFVDLDTVPPTVNSPCFIPPTNICYERTVYTDTLILPPSPGGYILSYQRCCRNITIVNLIGPENTGATYEAWIPGTTTYSQNSNPVFINWPPPFICANIPFIFDHSAIDFEGDSIVYDLITPYDGASVGNPMPQPPNAPPYSNVLFNPPYSVSDMIGGTPPMSIDHHTGILTCYPTTLGQFVIGVIAREYRGSIAVGYTRRDFQLNVVPCPTLVVAALQNPLISCGSNTVTFQNQSINAGTYSWNFGDPSTTTDVSTATTPSYTYPDTGQYQVTLIAYSVIDPGCADTTTGTVSILADFQPDFTWTIDSCNNTVTFNDTSNTISGITNSRNWTFGDGGTSTLADPVHQYAASGTYTVQLIASSTRGCIDTLRKTVTLAPLLDVQLQSTTPVRCYGECNGLSNAVAVNGLSPYSYQWNDPLQQNTGQADSLCIGTWQVLVTDNRGCTVRDSVVITQPSPLTLQITSTPDYCDSICGGSATALPLGGNGNFTYSWNDPGQQTTATAGHLCSGNYQVLVTDGRGCTIADSISIAYTDSFPVVNATADTTVLFTGQSTILHAIPGTGNYNYNWIPSTGLNNTSLPDPAAAPTVTTQYLIELTDVNGCKVTDSVTILVKDVLCAEPEIFLPTGFSPNGDQRNDVLYVRGNTIEKLYLAVYDRWGELVFETSSKDKGWDGTYKGKRATPDVYTYYLEVTCYDKSVFKKQGNITLLK